MFRYVLHPVRFEETSETAITNAVVLLPISSMSSKFPKSAWVVAFGVPLRSLDQAERDDKRYRNPEAPNFPKPEVKPQEKAAYHGRNPFRTTNETTNETIAFVVQGNHQKPGLLGWCEMDFVHPQFGSGAWHVACTTPELL